MITNWNDPIESALPNGPTEARVLEVLPDNSAVIRFRRRTGVLACSIIVQSDPEWQNAAPPPPTQAREVWLAEFRSGLGRAAYASEDLLLRQIEGADRDFVRAIKFVEVLV